MMFSIHTFSETCLQIVIGYLYPIAQVCKEALVCSSSFRVNDDEDDDDVSETFSPFISLPPAEQIH